MHIFDLEKYHFIDKFEVEQLNKLNKNISIIYRNYSKPTDLSTINKIKKFCKKKRVKFYLSNNIKLAIKLNLNGVYLPSFNKYFRMNCFIFKKNFKIIGSAHNLKQIRTKEMQKVNKLFISSVFKRKNTYLGLNKFRNLSKLTKIPVIALGGINKKNLNKLNLLNIRGFAAIKLFSGQKKGGS